MGLDWDILEQIGTESGKSQKVWFNFCAQAYRRFWDRFLNVAWCSATLIRSIYRFLCLGVLPVDLPFSPPLRVVHRRAAGRRAERRHQRPGGSHLHHAVLPQVRSTYYYAGEYRGGDFFLQPSEVFPHLLVELFSHMGRNRGSFGVFFLWFWGRWLRICNFSNFVCLP